jgi:hypothetical protein
MVNPRRRFWIELGLAVVSGVLFVLTFVRPDWIEVAFGIDPDQGDGSLEWGLDVVLLIATVAWSVVARLEWVEAAHAARRAQNRRRHTDWPWSSAQLRGDVGSDLHATGPRWASPAVCT